MEKVRGTCKKLQEDEQRTTVLNNKMREVRWGLSMHSLEK